MRSYLILLLIAGLALSCAAQDSSKHSQTEAPTMPKEFGNDKQPKTAVGDSREAKLSAMFQDKIKAEWEAIKHKDKKAYGELLADDYEGVEVDGKGERNRVHAISELEESNVFNYTLWGFKLIPAEENSALAIYEVTIQFPPKSVVHYSRVYISEFWQKRGEQWKEVHYQETHVK